MLMFYKLHRNVRYYLNCSKVHINDLIVAVEAATKGVTMGEDAVSGLMYAHDFVGRSGTPQRLQKHLEKELQ